MIQQMECEQCDDEHFDDPALLNVHGMIASEGEPACWGHSYEDDWWPCPRKASEEHRLMGELLAACEILYVALKSGPQSITQAEIDQIQAAITKAKGERHETED